MKRNTVLIIVICSLVTGMMYGCVEDWQPQYGTRYTFRVTSVIDGDTLDGILPNGKIDRVRLLGIDTPEIAADDNTPDEYGSITDVDCLAAWGLQAKYFTLARVGGKKTLIEFDEEAGFKDPSGRWLAYIYLDNGTDYCAELLTKGYARAYVEGTCSQEYSYHLLQQEAMVDQVGLWSCVEAEEGVSIILVHYDALGDDGDNLNDEYVVIKNNGDGEESLSGWSVEDDMHHVYIFPSGYSLAAGALVTLHTGSGINSQTDVYWGNDAPVWGNGHDTASLRDSSGTLIDSWGW